MQWKIQMKTQSIEESATAFLKKSAKRFIVDYAMENLDWYKDLIELNEKSHAQAVYKVKRELMKESVGPVMISEILQEILK